MAHELCGETGLLAEFPEDPGEGQEDVPWDIRIEGRTFRVVAAVRDDRNEVEFRDIQLDQNYDALLCLCITPSEMFMLAWTRECLTRNLVRWAELEEGVPLPKRFTMAVEDMLQLGHFEPTLRDVVAELDGDTAGACGPGPAS